MLSQNWITFNQKADGRPPKNDPKVTEIPHQAQKLCETVSEFFGRRFWTVANWNRVLFTGKGPKRRKSLRLATRW